MEERVISVPQDMKGLRACIACTLVQTFTEFYNEGCPNCEFLNLKENSERVAEVTTARFEGLAAVMNPEQSWVARWQRVSRLVPGCYALRVDEDLSEDIENELAEQGVPNLGKLSRSDE